MRQLGFAAAAAAALFATQVSAASVDITGISGVWTDTSGSPFQLTGLDTDSIRWGRSTGSGKSGYDFDAAGTPQNGLLADVLFDLGEFTHLNNPITRGSITGATLKVVIDLVINNLGVETMETIETIYNFAHLETPNGARPCADGGANGVGVNENGCADRVTATLNPNTDAVFEIGDDKFVFVIEGFKVGDSLLEEFWTKEKKNNSAILRGRYVLQECAVENPQSERCKDPVDPDDPAPVPLPAAGWLMLAGLGGLGALARRRRT